MSVQATVVGAERLVEWLRHRAKCVRMSAQHVRLALTLPKEDVGDHYSETQAVGYDLNARAYDRAAAAAQACADYDHWSSELRRIKKAIGECICPREEIDVPDGWFDHHRHPPSCFQRAAVEEFPGRAPDDGPTRRNLKAIAAAVTDCPSCSTLAQLVAEKRHASKRLGVAKREVRRIGRIILAEGPRA